MSISSYAQLGFAQGGDTKQNQPRRRYVGETWKKPGANFQEFSPVKSHNVCFILPVVTTPVKCGPLGSSLEMQCPGVLLVDCHAGMLCQKTYQNARVPEGRQLLIINHTVYTDNLGKNSHSYQLGW